MTSATSTWIAGSSNWYNATNWTPTGVPGAGATVNITNTDGAARVITYDYTGAAVTLASLTVDLTGNVANADTLSMAANNLSATYEYVGDSGSGTGGAGVFNQSGGTNNCNSLYLGYNPTDTGTYYLSGTATLGVSASEILGFFGSATINQSGGSNNVGTELVGDGNAGTTGTYLQTGGTNTAVTFFLGDYQGAAVYNLSGGSLTTTNRAYIGDTGSGASFIQTNGQFGALGSLTIGQTAPTTYNQSGGSLYVTGNEIIGAATAATYLQTGGYHSVSSDLGLGQSASPSTYNLSSSSFLGGGQLSIGGNFNVGNGGTATLLVSSFGAAVTVTGALNVGATAYSIGHVTLTGSLAPCNLSAGSIVVGGTATGAGGTATVTVGAGGVLVTAGTLTLYNNSNVALNLNGGTIDAGFISFNGSSTRFNWTSGTFNVGTGGITVDSSTSASSVGPSFLVSAGKTLLSPGGEFVGLGGSGSFSQTGGTNSSPYVVLGGNFGTSPGNANSSYTLSGGNLSITASGNGETVIGYAAPGQFNQTGGSLTTDLIALSAVGGVNSVMNLSGTGSVLANYELDLGFAGVGVINQSGGKVVVGSSSASGSLNIGCSAGSSGIYNLSAGSLTVNGNVNVGGYLAAFSGITGLASGPGGTGLLLIAPGTNATITGTLTIYSTTGTSVNLSGGSLSVGAMDTMGTPLGFNWTTGTLAVTNTNLAFDSMASTAADPLGPNFSLNSGQTLTVSLNENIGGVGLGSLTLNTGSTHTVLGNLSVNTGGTLNLSGGTLQTGSLSLSGGTINGTLTNQSLFTYVSGAFNGRLVNQGAVNFEGNFTATGGIENDASFVVNTGRTVTTGATGFDNLGTLNLYGGTLAGGTLVNDYSGVFTGYGTIQAALTNYATMNVTGPLTLSAASTNSGTITISTGAVIRGSSIANTGSITLTGGAITSALSNPAGGTIGGNGSIAGGLTTTGEIQPGPGTLTITTAWTNAGLVSLNSASAILSGGAITNTATIEGFGQIATTVLNTTGVIRAQGGELDLSGTGNTLGSTAQIQLPTNGSLVYVQGLATNAGTIAVSGGAFHNGNQPLTNTGLIEGTGTFDAGSWTNNAGAQINLTANANIFGPLTNAGAIHLYGTGITFYGNVTNTGTVKVTAGSVYFLGANGASIGGTYNSDPSDNYFNNLAITSAGTVTGGTGDRFFMLYGTPFTNAGHFNDLGTLSANIVTSTGTFLQTGTLVETGNFTNSGTATIGGTQNWSSGTVFYNTAGTANFLSDAGVTGENLALNISGGSVTLASTQHLLSITIASGSSAQITGAGTGHRSMVYTPSLADTGTLDLTANDLDVQGGGPVDLAAVTSLIQKGYSNGTWTGTGISSSTAAADGSHLKAVGVLLNTTYPSLDGLPVASNDVLAKLTYYGDANLDGKVDGSDYSLIDSGYLSHATGWSNGDFNYDGVVNGSDYTLIDNAFNRQGSQQLTEVASATAQLATPAGTAVPEPATCGLLILAAAGLLGRSSARRRFA